MNVFINLQVCIFIHICLLDLLLRPILINRSYGERLYVFDLNTLVESDMIQTYKIITDKEDITKICSVS